MNGPYIGMEHKLQIFTVYHNPIDYPGMYVCRQFNVDKPTNNYFANERYEVVIEWMYEEFAKLNQGHPYQIPRHETDDPKIIETWI